MVRTYILHVNYLNLWSEEGKSRNQDVKLRRNGRYLQCTVGNNRLYIYSDRYLERALQNYQPIICEESIIFLYEELDTIRQEPFLDILRMEKAQAPWF